MIKGQYLLFNGENVGQIICGLFQAHVTLSSLLHTYNMFFQAEIFLQVELHPKYDNVSSYYDIGLIYTDKDMNFNADVMPICLSNQPNPDVNFLASKSVHMAGWGRVTDQSDARRNELTLRQEYINYRTV